MDKKTIIVDGKKKTVWRIDGKDYTRLDIFKSYASYIALLALFLFLVARSFSKGDYWLAILMLPITIVLLLIPFKRRAIQDKLEKVIIKRNTR